MARRSRERIYLIPRWPGIAFGFLLLVIFAIGFGAAYFSAPNARGVIHTFGVSLIVAGVVAMIQSNENLRGLEILGCRSMPAPAGGKIELELMVRNSSATERTGLQIRPAVRWRRAWRGRVKPLAWIPVLEPGETKTLRLAWPAPRRGRFPVPDFWICSILPVGLCFAWKVFSGYGDYFVYPLPRGEPLEGSAERGKETGEGPSGGNEDVSGHRPYQPGDPISRMDWRIFARTGEVMVRTLEEGSGGEVTLRWEDTRFLEDPEARLEQLSYWVAQCVREGRPFRLELGRLVSLNHRNVIGCQEALATFDTAGL